ncbi:MAG: type II toxin-antitoxin system death-on-curing family toxin [Dehalococcoidia bacterium]|nr:type II toxin-antitoxin system death-on-curing family toxin [Dehalococcoidia bacterium]
MNYLSTVQILFLHSRLIAETGGSAGLRDVALLESAVARPQATYGGEDLYPDLFAKAAALMQSLVNNHPFVDGNKRAGIAATALFLQRNGHRLLASNQEVEEFTLAVAQGERTFDDIATWLASQTAPH